MDNMAPQPHWEALKGPETPKGWWPLHVTCRQMGYSPRRKTHWITLPCNSGSQARS